MAERIELPPEQHGTAEEQLAEIRSYLYRVATVLNVNQQMAGSETVALTDEERVLMNNVSKVISAGGGGNDTYTPGGQYTEVETLKSLIIKTAQFVKTVQDNYNLILYGEESAEGSSGNWNRKKGLRVDITPDGIKQTFSYAEIIGGLKDYVLNSKSYVKSGYLRNDAQDQPVYGVAVGNDVTQFLVDGTEVYRDENKVAELTPNELGFYQSNKKVASYTGSKIEFLQNNQERLTIDGDGMVIKDPSGNTLAEFKDNEVVFFQGGNAVAEYKGNELVFMLQGKKRMIVDASGLTIQDANEVKLAELFGTGLVFYQDGTAMAAYTAANQQQQTPAQITFSENIVMPSNVSDEKGITLTSGTSQVLVNPLGILLESGNSIVLIDPSQINMNTLGKVCIRGKDDSVIQLIGQQNNVDQTIFQADASGVVQAKTINSSDAVISDLEVTNLKVNGQVVADLQQHNIVISATPPASGNDTIWLEPAGSAEPYTVTKGVTNAGTGNSWSTVTTNQEWRQTCMLSSNAKAEGATRVKISGMLYKNGSTAAWNGELYATLNLSNGSSINMGKVGDFPYMQSLKWNYGFSKEMSVGSTIGSGVTITSVTYRFAINRTTDGFANLSYPNDVSVTVTGQAGGATGTECTVHYIP